MIDFLKYVNQSDEDKYNMLLEGQAENQQLQTEKEQLNSLVNSCQQEIRKLKSTLEEIREYINGAFEMSCFTKSVALYEEELNELLQIIDNLKKI